MEVVNKMSEYFNFEFDRENRQGFTEVIYCEGKPNEVFLEILDQITDNLNDTLFLLSKVTKEQAYLLKEKNVTVYKKSRFGSTYIIGGGKPKIRTGKVLILSGGSSDISVVEEIALALEFHGLGFESYQDVGVANLRRLSSLYSNIDEADFTSVIVVAGFEGALFSVVNSLFSIPVIAVPSPVGYGKGGQGEAALFSALQSCSPGLSVVNIGNGISAAAIAVRIANLIKST